METKMYINGVPMTPTVAGAAEGAAPASVEDAEKALKQAKARAKAERKRHHERAEAEARARKARRAALATFHDLADNSPDADVRLEAARELKAWGSSRSAV